MLPVIALVGRPNVGKSTLFNYLTRSRDALVADYPGLTRDRQYGLVNRDEHAFFVVDTGGINDDSDAINLLAMKQVQQALNEAGVILFLLDAREGLNPEDASIANQLRKLGKPIIPVLNKVDGINPELVSGDFQGLGLGVPVEIAATHGRGIGDLLDETLRHLSMRQSESDALDANLPEQGIKIAVVGRPNVGKSTLVNRILGEERVVVFDQPGTTRDSVYIPFTRNNKNYTLIDTAGVRRRARVSETIEKFSIVKTLQAIQDAHVVIYLIDASEGVTEQDASLLGMVLETGRALLIGLNKWDGLSPEQRNTVRRQLDVRLSFLDFAEKHVLSALHGTGVGSLFDRVDVVYESASRNISTSLLTRLLQEAVATHQPSLVSGRRIKLKYAHQGGQKPPVIVIHGNQTADLPSAYKRYLTNFFREKLGLQGTPIRLEFPVSNNPYKDRRNTLTPRQVQKRRRLMRHVKAR